MAVQKNSDQPFSASPHGRTWCMLMTTWLAYQGPVARVWHLLFGPESSRIGLSVSRMITPSHHLIRLDCWWEEITPTYFDCYCADKPNLISYQIICIGHMLIGCCGVVMLCLWVSFNQCLCSEVYDVSKTSKYKDWLIFIQMAQIFRNHTICTIYLQGILCRSCSLCIWQRMTS